MNEELIQIDNDKKIITIKKYNEEEISEEIFTKEEFRNIFLNDRIKANELSNYILENSEHIGSKFEQIIDIHTFESSKFEVLLETSDLFKEFLTKDSEKLIKENKQLKFTHGILFSVLEDNNCDFNKNLSMKHLRNMKNFEKKNNNGKKYEYGINISENDIENSEFLKFFKMNPELGKRIELEILETIPNNYLKKPKTIETLNKFNSLAARLKIDDFGAGENNIARIDILKQNYPLFKSIKFDKEYAQYLTVDSKNIYQIFKDELASFDKMKKNHKNNNGKLMYTENHKMLMMYDCITDIPEYKKYKVDKSESDISKSIKRNECFKILENLLNTKNRKKDENVQSIFSSFIHTKRQFVLKEMRQVSAIAEIIDLDVVCEFVENSSVLSKIIAYFPSIKYAQGFAFNKDGKECMRFVEGQLIGKNKEIGKKTINGIQIKKRLNDDLEVIEKTKKEALRDVLYIAIDKRTKDRTNTIYENLGQNERILKNKFKLDKDIEKTVTVILIEDFGISPDKIDVSSHATLIRDNMDKFVESLEKRIINEKYHSDKIKTRLEYDAIINPKIAIKYNNTFSKEDIDLVDMSDCIRLESIDDLELD